MAITPIQERFVDPFAAYNSNAVNMFTRMVSHNEDCILSNYGLDCTAVTDSTSQITLTPGSFIKSDMFITFKEDFVIDFTDSEFYTDGIIWNNAGSYYVVIEYNYVKSDPPRAANIKILKPTERNLLGQYLFINIINVVMNVHGHFAINSISSYASETLAFPEVKRKYVKSFICYEQILPTPFEPDRDRGRLIMTLDNGYIYGDLTKGESDEQG